MNRNTQVIKRDYQIAKRNTNKLQLDNYYKNVFEKRRNTIINLLSYLPHIQQLKKDLNSEQVYRAIFEFVPGEGLCMWTDKSGKTMPSLKDQYNIIRQQARLVPLPKEIYSTVNGILVQNKLGDISEQLVQIDKKVEQILMGQHNDRVAIIQGAQDTIQQATLVADEALKHILLGNAISELNKGRRQMINETIQYTNEFNKLSRHDLIKMIKAILGKLDYNKMYMQAISVHKNMQMILEATYYQMMAYDLAGESFDMQDILNSIIKVDSHNAYIEEEINKWIGGEENFTFNIFNNLMDNLKEYKTMDNLKLIELEFTGKEILEIKL